MTKTLGSLVLGAAIASPAYAQAPPQASGARQVHYQIGVMERVLEGAVEHGVAILRDRLQAIAPDAPAELLILDIPRVRGFRLDGYGVFFDVEVPPLNGTLMWSLNTLDQNDLGLQNALNTLRARLDPADVDLQQALKRVELQVGPAPAVPVSAPVPVSAVTPTLPTPRRAAPGAPDRPVTAASVPAQSATTPAAAAPPPQDRILENPNEAYRAEVVQALVDAMIDFSGALSIGADEWMTIAARGIQDRPRFGPADNDAQTVMIRVRGADLAAFRAGQVSRDEVSRRIEKRVF